MTADGVTVIVLDGFVSYVGIVDKEMDWPKMEASWKAKHPEDV